MDIDREALGLEHWSAFWPIHVVTLWTSSLRQAGHLSLVTLLGCVQAWVINSRPIADLNSTPGWEIVISLQSLPPQGLW